MKITKIPRAKDYRIFRDYTWPAAGLPEFARFNVIYGWNGAGKTSLSNIFRHVERKAPLTDGQIELAVDQTRVSGTDFATAALPNVRTFNRDTVNRSIFESSSQQFPPVFFIGEDSVEKQRAIEDLKQQLEVQIQAESRSARSKTDTTAALESFCSDQAKAIKNLLTVAGGGPFNNYYAPNFKADIQRLLTQNPLPTLLTQDQSQAYLTTKDSKVMERVAQPQASFPDFVDLIGRTQKLLEKSVVSSVIAALADSPAVAQWVSAGLSLHTGENLSSHCKFCDQVLPEERIAKLEAHFNNEFKRFQEDIDALIHEIAQAKNFTQELRLAPKEALYRNLRADYERSIATLQQQTLTASMSLDVLLRALRAKRDEPFKTVELRQFIFSDQASNETAGKVETFFQIALAGLAALGAVMGKTAFDQIGSIVDAHNQHTDKFDTELTAARNALAQDEVLKALREWQIKTDALETAREQVATASNKAALLRQQIRALEADVLQHRRPAEELNQEIAAYLGRDELQFEVEQNGYRITRGGHPANHLSDGERTAISFLYFLKSLKGSDFNLETGIVVIDDPVSSLDANSLFSAFGYMKQRTASAGQLFVLTHNFTFFRQVRNWFYNMPDQKKKDIAKHPARFYMLETEFANGVRTAKIGALDPFLHQYESEYHYLFKRVYEEAHKPLAQGLEAYYALPNIARRLLEAFLAFRLPDTAGELFKKLEELPYDPAKKTRILRFLHTYSHHDQIAEPGDDLSALSEAPTILRELLALIGHADPDHLSRMTALINHVAPSAANAP